MRDRSFLHWPFFDAGHRIFANTIEQWAQTELLARVTPQDAHGDAMDASLRLLVRELGRAGLLAAAIPVAHGGRAETFDVRALCLARETLAFHLGLADFAFAMQGLGSGAITLFGTDVQKAAYLPRVGRGEAIAAFALSEAHAGSDVGAMTMAARRDGGDYVLDGEKTWISNAGLADFYTVFARVNDAPGTKGLAAFVVDAGTPGLTLAGRIDVIAPHPLGTLRFENCRVPAAAMIGAPGEGFRIAMSVLDVFRSTVGAAALGFARRALAETLTHATARHLFGAALSSYQLTQAAIADMALGIDAAALLIYRAAWTKDTKASRVTREAAMAKLYATEMAQEVIDRAVQLHGGRGVVAGATVETLYREIRALRIYEGASEVQKLVIANAVLQTAGTPS